MTNIQRFRQITRILLIFGDLLYIPLIYFGSYWIRSISSFYLFEETMPLDRIHWVNHRLWLLMGMHLTFLYFHGLYDRTHYRSKNQIIGRIFQAVTLEILILVAVYFFSQDIVFPRSIFILLWVFNFVTTTAWHLLWYTVSRKQVPIRNLLIVGLNDSTRNLLKEIERLPSYGLKVTGVLSDDDCIEGMTEFNGYPILGSRDQLLPIVKEHGIDEVVISTAGSWQESLIDRISRSEQTQARICIIPTCYEILIGKINHLRLYDIPLIEVIKQPMPPTGKRFGDFVLALALFLSSLPIILLTFFAIKITSDGPALFKQKRVGRNRKPFTILKFRTMVHDAEDHSGPILSEGSDERIIPIGRFLRRYRIDELPQLINIIKGEMSFVGPRPERPFFVAKYIDSIPGYGERFKSMPGLTGLAQVNGGYATTPENKLKYDLAYIYNQTFWLDARIILETVKVILTGRVNP